MSGLLGNGQLGNGSLVPDAVTPGAQLSGGAPVYGGSGGMQGLPMPPGTTFNANGSPVFTQQSPQDAAISQYYLSQSSPYDPAIAAYNAYYGPQTSALQTQGNSLQERLYAQGLYGQQSQDAAQRQYASQLGLLGVDQRGNAIDQQRIGNLLGLYGQQTGLYRNLYDAQNIQAQTQAGQQRFDLNSKTTAKGSWGSVGQLQGLSTIDQLMNQAINANEAQFGIAKNQNDISTERLNAQKANLENVAGTYGLKADALKASLDAGLAKLGLDNIMSSGQLADMITSNDVQQATLGRTIIDQALNTPQNVLDYLQAHPEAVSQFGGAPGSTGSPAPTGALPADNKIVYGAGGIH